MTVTRDGDGVGGGGSRTQGRVSVALVVVFCLMGLAAVVPGVLATPPAVSLSRPVRLLTDEGVDCGLGGMNDDIVVGNCPSAGGDTFHVFRCNLTTGDDGLPGRCYDMATIPPVNLTDFAAEGIAWMRARAVTGNATMTIIAAEVKEPSTGYSAMGIWYCWHELGSVTADCEYTYGLFNNFLKNEMADMQWYFQTKLQFIAVVWSVPDTPGGPLRYPGIYIYRCSPETAGMCYQTEMIFDMYYYPFGNMSLSFDGFYLAVGDRSFDNFRGGITSYDCHRILNSYDTFGNCDLIGTVTLPPSAPPGVMAGHDVQVVAPAPGSADTRFKLAFTAPYYQTPLGTVGRLYTLLCNSLAGGGACTIVQHQDGPILPDSSPATVSQFGVRRTLASRRDLLNPETVIYYVGASGGASNQGAVVYYPCDAGVLCRPFPGNRLYVSNLRDGAPSDNFGSRVDATVSLTAVQAGNNAGVGESTWIVEMRNVEAYVAAEARRRAVSTSQAPASGNSASAEATAALLGSLIPTKRPAAT
jgi:hypothetical protein